MSNISLVLLVGIPGAGKTTFCHKLKPWVQDFNLNIINYDDLCLDYTSASRKKVFNRVETLIPTCLADLQRKHLIIIDDNLYYKSMRTQYFNLAKRFQLGFFKVYFEVRLELAIYRNNERSNGKIPEEILINIYRKLEVPRDNTFVINANAPLEQDTYTKFQCQVLNSLSNPVKSIQILEVENKCETSSKLHSIDLVLRKIVTKKILLDKNSSSKYNIIKSVVFQRIKNGDIIVNDQNNECLFDYLNNFFNI